MRLTMRSPARRAGLKYGFTCGAISIIAIAPVIVTGSNQWWRPLGALSGPIVLLFLSLGLFALLSPVFAGRAAAQEIGAVSNDSVRAGAVAGLVTGVVSTLVAWPGELVQYLIAPQTIRALLPLTPSVGELAVVWLALEYIVETGMGLAIVTLLGMFGGFLGRQANRRALLAIRQ